MTVSAKVEIAITALFGFGALSITAEAPRHNAWPGNQWPSATPDEVGMDTTLLAKARDYALVSGGSGMIVRHGSVVIETRTRGLRVFARSRCR